MNQHIVVDTNISPNDEMMFWGNEHYFSVGRSAMESIEAALATNGSTQINKILDLPCGHGRVARYLKARFPDSQLFVSDLNEDGARFCSSQFGGLYLKSTKDFEDLEFNEKFDLIWTGSLITHFSQANTKKFFRFVLNHLSKGGVAVVSSHGPLVVGRSMIHAAEGTGGYGLSPKELNEAINDFFVEGYGYRDYPTGMSEYGISYISRAWLDRCISELGGEVILYREHAWDRHHDVVAFRKRAKRITSGFFR